MIKGFLFLLFLSALSIALGLDTLLPTLTESLVLGTLSVHLFLEGTLTELLSLGPLDLCRKRWTRQLILPTIQRPETTITTDVAAQI